MNYSSSGKQLERPPLYSTLHLLSTNTAILSKEVQNLLCSEPSARFSPHTLHLVEKGKGILCDDYPTEHYIFNNYLYLSQYLAILD